MQTRIPVLFVVWIASACASAPPETGGREVAFACGNGESISVRFLAAEERAVLLRHGTRIELQQQPSGSGFIYSNGPNTIRGKGDQLTVEIGRMAPIECRAQQESGSVEIPQRQAD